MGLRNDYLQDLCDICLKSFESVLPCDYFYNFPVKSKQKFIVNLSPSNVKSGHFVIICFDDNDVLYFDPYGLKCSNEFILKKIISLGTCEIIYSTKRIQQISSMYCGLICLACLIYIENKSIEEFLNLFDENLHKNENICLNIIKDQLRDEIK